MKAEQRLMEIAEAHLQRSHPTDSSQESCYSCEPGYEVPDDKVAPIIEGDADGEHVHAYCHACSKRQVNPFSSRTLVLWPCETWVLATQPDEVVETWRALVTSRDPYDALLDAQALAARS